MLKSLIKSLAMGLRQIFIHVFAAYNEKNKTKNKKIGQIGPSVSDIPVFLFVKEITMSTIFLLTLPFLSDALLH